MNHRVFLCLPAAMVLTGGVFLCGGCEDSERSNAADRRTGAPADVGQPPLGRSDSEYNLSGARDDVKTAFDQSESPDHIRMTADVRRAIMEDDTLSTGAKNCTVVTDEHGMVTLIGTVASQAEKNAIEARAKAVAGEGRVTNRLEVRVR